MQATITVQEIRPPKPGGKKYLVVDASGDYYYVWPDKIANYQVGSVYDVEFTQTSFKGNPVRSIDTARRSSAPPQQAAPRPAGGGGGGNTYRETSAADAERMFVTAIVRAGVQAGSVALNTGDLVSAVNDARQAWQETFAAQPAGQRAPARSPAPRGDMNDEIPF